jgi:hypothetical protein
MELVWRKMTTRLAALVMLGGLLLGHPCVAHSQGTEPSQEAAKPEGRPLPRPAPKAAAPKPAEERQMERMERMPARESREVEGAKKLPKAGITEIRRGEE